VAQVHLVERVRAEVPLELLRVALGDHLAAVHDGDAAGQPVRLVEEEDPWLVDQAERDVEAALPGPR